MHPIKEIHVLQKMSFFSVVTQHYESMTDCWCLFFFFFFYLKWLAHNIDMYGLQSMLAILSIHSKHCTYPTFIIRISKHTYLKITHKLKDTSTLYCTLCTHASRHINLKHTLPNNTKTLNSIVTCTLFQECVYL